jgi:hypothetical protein
LGTALLATKCQEVPTQYLVELRVITTVSSNAAAWTAWTIRSAAPNIVAARNALMLPSPAREGATTQSLSIQKLNLAGSLSYVLPATAE